MLGELKSSHLAVSIIPSDRFSASSNKHQITSKDDARGLGAGFLFRKIEDSYIVYRVLEGSSAQKAGVKVGWLVTHRNGERFPPRQAGERRAGQSVNFRFLTPENQEENLTLTYQWLVIQPQLINQWLDGNIAYLKFDKFDSDTDQWLARQVTKYHSARGMIVDLRGNLGGYVKTLRRCLDLFFAKRELLGTFEGLNHRQTQLRTTGLEKRAFGGQLVVLVDEASESSAEIFAAAIMESGRGQIVGRKTGGKVLSATTKKLPENFQLLLPIHNYRTASGKILEGTGVSPTVVVALNRIMARQLRDPDIERALAILK